MIIERFDETVQLEFALNGDEKAFKDMFGDMDRPHYYASFTVGENAPGADKALMFEGREYARIIRSNKGKIHAIRARGMQRLTDDVSIGGIPARSGISFELAAQVQMVFD